MTILRSVSPAMLECAAVAILISALGSWMSPTHAAFYQNPPPCLATVTAATIERQYANFGINGNFGVVEVQVNFDCGAGNVTERLSGNIFVDWLQFTPYW